MRLLKQGYEFMHHAQVMFSKYSRFGHEQAKVGVFYAFHDNAGASGRAVNNDRFFRGRRKVIQSGLDDRNPRGFSGIEHAGTYRNIARSPLADYPDCFWFFRNCFGWAKKSAAAAGMADVVKHFYFVADKGQSVVLAEGNTGPAASAKRCVYNRNRNGNRCFGHIFRLKKQMSVRFFHITVHI